MNARNILKVLSITSIALLMFFVHYEYQAVFELKNYRTSDDHLKRGVLPTNPSTEGLADLHISGSARPTREGLRNALANKAMPVYIFDVFAEKQYYINGLSENWYGYKRSNEVGHDQKNLKLRSVMHRLVYTGKLSHDAADTQTPQQMVESLGFHHIQFDCVRKQVPTNQQVDEFIERVESLPAPAWVHFHCSAGKGRTTIAMVMYDIMKNGQQVPLQDIVARHYLLGSENLFDTTVWPNGRYTKEMLEDRKNFVIRFYDYINSPNGYGVQSWSNWTQNHS